MARGYEEIELVLPDGYRAYGRFWRPGVERGAVLYHHGIQSHCGWYEGSAAALVEAGFAVLQTDRRGCGRNEAGRGHAESAEQLIADAHAAGDELLRRTQAGAYHVVGVSWGGKLAVAAYVDDARAVKSLSLVTPGFFPRVGVSRETMAEIGFAMLYQPEKAFDIPLDDPERFTSDAAWQRFIATDEWTLRQCTAGFYLASRRMDKLVAKLASCSPVPVHLVVAGDERIIDNEKTVRFIEQLPWPKVNTTTYPALRHSLEFEGRSYLNDMVAFVRGVE
jgi:alpha-beta hydrolase superfamily lysophospholipase